MTQLETAYRIAVGQMLTGYLDSRLFCCTSNVVLFATSVSNDIVASFSCKKKSESLIQISGESREVDEDGGTVCIRDANEIDAPIESIVDMLLDMKINDGVLNTVVHDVLANGDVVILCNPLGVIPTSCEICYALGQIFSNIPEIPNT